MWEIWGGDLQFEWNQKVKRMIPKVKWDKEKKRWTTKNEDYKTIWIMRNNEEEIRKWISDIGSRLRVSINVEDSSNKGIAIDVEKNELLVVENSLDRHQIDYNMIYAR